MHANNYLRMTLRIVLNESACYKVEKLRPDDADSFGECSVRRVALTGRVAGPALDAGHAGVNSGSVEELTVGTEIVVEYLEQRKRVPGVRR